MCHTGFRKKHSFAWYTAAWRTQDWKQYKKIFQKQWSNFNICFEGMQAQNQLKNTLLDVLKKQDILSTLVTLNEVKNVETKLQKKQQQQRHETTHN